jgi:hypothetical protein
VFRRRVSQWKKVPAERAAGVFGKDQGHRANGEAALISRLRQRIGQLEAGRGFLAKRSRS